MSVFLSEIELATIAAEQINNLPPDELEVLQSEQAEWQANQANQNNSNSMDWIASAINGVGNISEQFNTGYQENQLAIANANAAAAKAIAAGNSNQKKPNYLMYAAIAFVVILVVVFILKNRK